MSPVRSNVVANIAGQAWAVLLSIACVPFYVKLLGIEAYGLIAFYVVVQGILQVLDLGLSATVNREVARFTATADQHASAIANFIVTLERWYWLLGISLGTAVLLALPAIAGWWLQPQALPDGELLWSARAYALIALLHWPNVFYQSAMAGLQRQVAINAIQMPFAALGSIGGVLFLWLGPRSVVALIGWQGATFILQLLATYTYFWRHIGFTRQTAATDLSVLRRHWRFSLGMSGITITGLIITHIDKIILSRLLPLQTFGHYSLAVTVARGLYVLISPVFAAYFPRFSGLVAKGERESLKLSYHAATQIMAVLILPLALVIAIFPKEIIAVWLQDEELAGAIAPIAAILVVGTCLNGLMNIPFALQLAHGRTSIGLIINAGLTIVLVPSVIFATIHLGALGGAMMWALSNAAYLLIGMPVTHHYLLKDASWEWVIKDVLPPLVAALAVVGTARLLITGGSVAWTIASIAAVWVMATCAAGASGAHVRRFVRHTFEMRRGFGRVS